MIVTQFLERVPDFERVPVEMDGNVRVIRLRRALADVALVIRIAEDGHIVICEGPKETPTANRALA